MFIYSLCFCFCIRNTFVVMFLGFKISARQPDHPNACIHPENPCVWLETPAICLTSHRHCLVNERWVGMDFMLKSFTSVPVLDLGCFLILPLLNWQKTSHYFFVIIIVCCFISSKYELPAHFLCIWTSESCTWVQAPASPVLMI